MAFGITDLISCIEDADQNYPDHIKWLGCYGDRQIAENFKKFELTPINKIIEQHASIRNIYLTRGAEGFWKRLWMPVQAANVTKTLLTPSDWARIQHRKFNKRNPQQRIENLPDFIRMRWKSEWHF